MPKATEAIDLAIKLDAKNATAQRISGQISLETGKTIAAEKSLLKSIELNNKSSTSYKYLSIAQCVDLPTLQLIPHSL